MVLLDYTEICGSFQGISMYKIEHIFLCIFSFGNMDFSEKGFTQNFSCSSTSKMLY